MLKCCEERFKSKKCALSHLKCEIVASTKMDIYCNELTCIVSKQLLKIVDSKGIDYKDKGNKEDKEVTIGLLLQLSEI